MKSDRLITGLVLVLIGVTFLLHNFGYIDFRWGNIFRLWPVFLLIAGVNLALSNKNSAWATAIKIIVVLGGFSLILFADLSHRSWSPAVNFKYEDDDAGNNGDYHGGVVKKQGTSIFNEPFTDSIKVAQLNIAGGATTYKLSDTTDQLFNAQTQEFVGRYGLSNTTTDSLAVLDFKMLDGKSSKFKWDTDKDNSATIKLNARPEWDISVKTGASEIDFDLTKFKVRSLKLNGGAASFKVKLGQPLTVTNIDVLTGVSEINLYIPQNTACSITTSSGLSSTDFDGFTKAGDHRYETLGFANAANKMYIKINGGLSDFNVKRY
ncbi:hypothetical protein DJ568_13275 [Mucilaginibacter hurinus]|uniref:LiaI-LiaF-like transmembrane region domain-containing protein n=1 Tax=Mucilaginibacter hurinus TaxID=2201324 RepID=A0A367GL99_9SPHI|nr:DUF5668 domain-containing protein [Mucilaginibacter hurinus]RCH54262.1 hypothetical protein DJ568_13275 [Mucilaginibacter hurinus]